MRPSKFSTVKAKKAWFLPSGFSALTWKGCVYCRSQKAADMINATDNIGSQLESHETIHVRQAETMNNSWFNFYAKYIWEWIKNLPLVFIDSKAPYKFMPIEMEAYLNQDDWEYCMHGLVYRWKEFEKLKLKDRKKLAKEYYGSVPRPYFAAFLRKKLNED